ncbi:MAG TPA: tRNA uridine(34) 5-carboxymethylaminomethyl modification radical SAM/GNAT enzyme Elp3 [Candidatus Bilamarchaeum sp.]|nr:tRNA uridine(34) 5-carboxymethylaminomethyl modification radical SAM/GNAT enzyme Elp3 [Candidatus Bilamarchaeum sp.]
MSRKEAISFIVREILGGRRDIEKLKREAAKAFRPTSLIKNPEIIAAFPEGTFTPEIRGLLLKKPVKTLSGVTPVAVMTRPQASCRWGCVFCPFTGLAAKSYTGFEPAALRGRQFGFDSFMQASSRVKQFEGGGHPAEKCEVIVMGGTFLETDAEYKYDFIKGVYDGLNGFRSPTLAESVAANEKEKHRVVGLTIETRPDVCINHIGEMLSYGATRVELGVQNPDDSIYETVNRGHTVRDVVESTAALKDSAFKVLYHVMPGLPGSGPEKDIAALRSLFADERFQPDMLKIYPTLVVGGTVLKQWADEGRYEPYSTEAAAEVISEFYRYIPKYVRVMRIQRDIPAPRIERGVKKSNLRELVEARLREKSIVPQEIRYREAGLAGRNIRAEDFRPGRVDYRASGGKEVFLSYESAEGLIAGFIRLRFPPSSPRKEISPESALIRELHVYGSEVPIAAEGKIQHRGIGSSLLNEAENIARDAGKEKMVIISGVGVREYYRKLGYSLDGPYMSKML